ncbi:MAG: alpha/beta hydrolase [Brevinema sp.]
MIYLLILLLVVLFLVLNHSTIFHRPIRQNILELKSSCTEDLWIVAPGNKKLLICLHGMFSTPKTFEDLGEELVKQGWDIYAPTLPASAATREELQTIGAWAWEESLIVIREKIKTIPQHYQHTVLCGHSQGGSLAMNIATEQDFDALIIVASPIRLYGNHLLWWENIAIYLSGLLSFILSNGLLQTIKNPQERYLVEKCCDAEGIQYPYTIFTFKRGLKILRTNLHKIKIPLFLAYCEGDVMVNHHNLEWIKSSVSSKIIETKKYRIPYEEEPYGFRHQLLNYSKTKSDLFKMISVFLKERNF